MITDIMDIWLEKKHVLKNKQTLQKDCRWIHTYL